MLSLSVQAKADVITLFNTGVDASGNPLAGGSLDPHWSIIAGPGITSPVPAVILNNQQVGTYAQSTDSRWIWVNASGAAATGSPYTFRSTFDLTGFNPSTVAVSGSWGVDNDGSILLNGRTPTGSGALTLDGGDVSGNYTAFHNFQVTGGFVSGINTIDFMATDLGVVGGLNVNHLVETVLAVPEPSSVLMAATGAMIVMAYSRRRGRGALAASHPKMTVWRSRKMSAGRRRTRGLRPAIDHLDERVVPSSMQVWNGDLVGIAGGGTVWHNLYGRGWSQVGSLTGAAQVLETGVGVTQIYAQLGNNSLYVTSLTGATPQWTALNRSFLPGSMIASRNGIAGIVGGGLGGLVGGGTVWYYDTTSGWSQVGNLANVTALVDPVLPGMGGLGGTSPGLYAQRSDNSIWFYSYSTRQWTSLGAYLVPGTMVATSYGVAGLAGGGTVWDYTFSTRSWSQAGGKGGFVGLSSSGGLLFAEQPDASVWAYTLFSPPISNEQWPRAGVYLVPGSVISENFATAGIGGGGTVWQYNGSFGQGWVQDAGMTGAVALANTSNVFGGILYAQRSDHSIWAYRINSSTLTGSWSFTGAYLV
jgi:hypothetical protein